MDNLAFSKEATSFLKLLKLDQITEEHLDILEKHGIVNFITKELLLRKSSDEQVKMILSGGLPIAPKDLPIVTFLLVKNYQQLFQDIFQFIIKLDSTSKKNIASFPLFEGGYLTFLCKLLKNDPLFVSHLISLNKIDLEIVDILANSNEPEVLYRISHMRHIIQHDLNIVKKLLSNPYTPDEALTYLRQLYVELNYQETEEEEKVETHETESKEENQDIKTLFKETQHLPSNLKRELEENLAQRISKMTTPEKIKLALKGNKSARMYLIRDPNKQISLSVLENPKITEDEILFLVKSKSTPDHIIREIAKNNNWSNNYSVVRDMIFNPKTPLDISMNLIGKISTADLEKLSKSKEIPSALKNQALRIFLVKTGKKQ